MKPKTEHHLQTINVEPQTLFLPTTKPSIKLLSFTFSLKHIVFVSIIYQHQIYSWSPVFKNKLNKYANTSNSFTPTHFQKLFFSNTKSKKSQSTLSYSLTNLKIQTPFAFQSYTPLLPCQQPIQYMVFVFLSQELLDSEMRSTKTSLNLKENKQIMPNQSLSFRIWFAFPFVDF